MTPELETLLDDFNRRAGRLVVLTGAGISAESGIPTFRGKDGYWTVGSTHYRPEELATYAAFRRMPEELWRWYAHRRRQCHAAEPNAGHRALVGIEHALRDRFQLVSQNVDGLHRRAGSSPARLYEIHGNLDRMRCSRDCRPDVFAQPEAWVALDEVPVPLCDACGAAMRPHVLWFDESYDEEHFHFESSLAAADRADLLLVVGTSGATTLPRLIAERVLEHGGALIDVNPEPSPFGSSAVRRGQGVWWPSSAGSALEEIAQALGAHS